MEYFIVCRFINRLRFPETDRGERYGGSLVGSLTVLLNWYIFVTPKCSHDGALPRFRVANYDSDPGIFITAAYILKFLNRNFPFLQYISIVCFDETDA